jgi:hypothetical protein
MEVSEKMKHISKYAPLYFTEFDTWYNERDKNTYQCDVRQKVWKCEGQQDVPFPKKFHILNIKESNE